MQPQLRDESAQVAILRSGADERQRRVRPPVLNDLERANRRRDVVERVEVARRQQARPQRIAVAEPEAVHVDEIRNDVGADTEVAEYVDQKTRRDDVALDARDRPTRDRRPREMVRRLAAAVVQDDRFAERARDEHRRQRCEEKRRVRRREDVDDVGAGDLAYEFRNVGQLRDDRAQVLHVEHRPERRRRHRIHGNQPRVHVRVVVPGAQQAIRLDGLSAENPQRRCDDGHTETVRHDVRTRCKG